MEPEEKHPEITKNCECCLCGKPVTITVYAAFSSEEDCLNVVCDECESEQAI